MHSQRKLDARRDRLRRRDLRRRRALQGLAALLVAAAAVVALRPRPSHSNPILTPYQEAAAAQTAHDWSRMLRGWRAHPGPVPVLMYHRLEKPGSASGARELFVSPRLFRAQLAALRRHGYHPVTLARVAAAWDRGALLPRKPIVLTFDDGYRSQYTVAFRAMRKLGWRGRCSCCRTARRSESAPPTVRSGRCWRRAGSWAPTPSTTATCGTSRVPICASRRRAPAGSCGAATTSR